MRRWTNTLPGHIRAVQEGDLVEQPTIQEIQAAQGTRLQEKAPWETYATEMGQFLDPKLAQEVADYSERRYDAKPSNESLETLQEEREKNQEISEQYKFVDQKDYQREVDHIAPRIGRVMHPHKLLLELRRAGVNCWFREHPHRDKVVIVIQLRPGLPLEVGCWAQYGLMPEYSLWRFDEYGVQLDERRRGWRTVLLQLIMKGALTEENANRVFGEPMGPASGRSLALLYAFRNRNQKWEE